MDGPRQPVGKEEKQKEAHKDMGREVRSSPRVQADLWPLSCSPNVLCRRCESWWLLDFQRKEYKKHCMGMISLVINEKRIARLERFGMQWDPQTSFDGKDGLRSMLANLRASSRRT